MKTIMSFFILIISFCNLYAQTGTIQTKIENALTEAFHQQSPAPLTAIHEDLNKQSNPMSTYWQAYTLFYEGIYYLKTGQKDLCTSSIEKAENLLEKQANKTSETYALLAYIQSFTIQFKSGMEAGKLAAIVRNNGEKAIQLDSANTRAWYVLACNDYYTPAAYGGGLKAENYLLKALKAKSQTPQDPWFPSWGKEETYEMLIRLYLDKGKTEKARNYFNTLKELFPQSYCIGQLEEKFSKP